MTTQPIIPTKIIFQNASFYSADELYAYLPKHFKGCAKARNVVEKKNLKETEYTFMYMKDEKYVSSTKKCAKAKLFLTEEWTLANIPEMNETNLKLKPVVDRYEHPEAPDVLELEDGEKFKDDKGNILEIEVRGERNHKECYFSVKDVSVGFDMPNLKKVLIDNDGNYDSNFHYKYFAIVKLANDGKKLAKKSMFLTYFGFRKVINVSRKQFSSKTLFLLNKWLEQFDDSIVDEYLVQQSELDNDKEGYVYCVTSDLLNAIKIGFWRGTLAGLRQRYVTSYGKNLSLHYAYTMYPYTLEKECHKHFNKQKITNELFVKEYIKEYVEYINKNIKIE
jgi:hypothetical protein